jgi:hypothetical protein
MGCALPEGRSPQRRVFDRSVRRARIGLTIFVLVAATACRTGASPGASEELEEAQLPVGPIRLSVDNRSPFHVMIYATRGSLRQRIGSMAGTSQSEFVIPDTFTNDRGGLALQVLQLAGPQTYVSDSFTPQRGARVLVTVHPRLTSSTLVIE